MTGERGRRSRGDPSADHSLWERLLAARLGAGHLVHLWGRLLALVVAALSEVAVAAACPTASKVEGEQCGNAESSSSPYSLRECRATDFGAGPPAVLIRLALRNEVFMVFGKLAHRVGQGVVDGSGREAEKLSAAERGLRAARAKVLTVDVGSTAWAAETSVWY